MIRTSLKGFLVLGAAAAMAACSSDTTSGGTDGGTGATGSGGKGGSGGSAGKAGSGGSGAAGASGSAGTAGAAGSGAGDAGATPVTIMGRLVIAIQGHIGKEDPLPGVTACVLDATGAKKTSIPCQTTDSMGAFSFSFAPSQQLIVEFTKNGYNNQLIAVDVGTADADRGDIRLAPLTSGDAGDAGVTAQTFGWDPSVVLDPTKGYVNLVAITPAASPDAGTAATGFDFTTGVSFTVTPKSGVGPFYNTASDETWAATATSTVGGYAWFLNLAPGTYSGKATSTTMTCSAIGGNGYGWAKPDQSQSFPILAGVNTQTILFYCVPKATDAGHD